MHNKAETLFERLDAKGLTWRVYCDPPSSHYSLTGIIHASRLRSRFATNFYGRRISFEDAEAGRCRPTPSSSRNMWHGHNDMHPPISALMP